MSQLNQLQFSTFLADFVNKFNKHSKEKWTLHQSSLGICAKQSVMVKWRESVVNRQIHITYNSVYSVPVLWFNIYTREGTPLTSVEALELSSENNGNIELHKFISQNEHPILGLLFYNIHPCNTMKIMQELTGPGNYIAKWLSVYGSPVGVTVPSCLFEQISEISQSSEDGSI